MRTNIQRLPKITQIFLVQRTPDRRQQVILATKFGIVRTSDPNARGINGKPEYVRSACEASLRRLGVDSIDLYYQHRVDPNTPIEETVEAMAQLVKEGLVRYIGLSLIWTANLASCSRCTSHYRIAKRVFSVES